MKRPILGFFSSDKISPKTFTQKETFIQTSVGHACTESRLHDRYFVVLHVKHLRNEYIKCM